MFTSRILPKVFTVMTVLILALSSLQSALAAPSEEKTVNNTVPFQGTFHHFTPPEEPCEAGGCTVSYGYGTVNIMGSPFVSITAYAVWDLTTSPCPTLELLEFILVGETGTITISGSGSNCPGNSPQLFPVFFTGVGEITGGTGEFSGITGTINSQGLIGPIGPIIHMSGDVSY